MKIAIIADPIDNQKGGIHVYTREVVKALQDYDTQNEYILVREKHDPAITKMEQLVIPNLRFGLGLAALRLFFWVPYILSKKGVDIVVEPAHFGPFNLPKRIKRVTVIHDLTPILFPEHHRFHSRLLQQIFLSRILKKADLVLSNSQNTTKDLHQHYPVTQSKTKTILLGVDHHKREATESRAYLDSIGLHLPYWLYVGTIEPRKNLISLLDAYERFRKQEDTATPLVIVGQKGWKSTSFFEKLEAHPYKEDIILPGFVPDAALEELFSHAIGLIYPSQYEGFGFPVLEAFACNCLVICSNNSSLTEVGGEIAFYCQADDPATITNQMQKLFHLPSAERAALKEKAKQWAANFRWEKYAASFVRALEGLNLH